MATAYDPDEPREAERLAKLRSFAILDTPREHEFDTIVALARRQLDCPIALVSLVDDHRQWFKARCGLSAVGTPRDQAFCAHAIAGHDIMVVEDATRDPRFAANPLVTGEPGIRFYAGMPLRPSAEGFDDDLGGVGTLCVIDTRPRTLSGEDAETLRGLAQLASALIRARAAAANERAAAEEVHAYAAIVESKNRQLRQAERLAGIGSWRFDIVDRRIEWSDHVFAIHGLPAGDMPAIDEAMDFYPEPDRARLAAAVDRAARLGEPFDCECDLVTATGALRRVRSVGEAELVDGRPVALIGVFQDVTEHHAREQSLRRSADTDSLTGLPNRGAFEVRLDAAIERAVARREPLALLLLDLDGFKAVNDSFGHDAGDEVLRTVAARLRGTPFQHSFAARLGGDEFVVVVTRPRDCAELDAFVARGLAALRHAIERGGERRAVSATIGAARLAPGVTAPADLLRRADLALYEAKRAERGTGRIHGAARVLRAEPADAAA